MPQGTAPDRDALVCVGAVAGAFGVKGEVRLKSFCADPRAIAAYGPLWTEDGARSYEVTLGGEVAGGLAARLSGVRSREEAEALKGLRLHAERARMPATGEDEFYYADLIGLEVADTGGAVLGRVAAVLNHGAGDILEVRRTGGKDTLLLPFTLAVVPTVDLAARRVVVDPPGESE
jgi:16S rRNA processing protein RimM